MQDFGMLSVQREFIYYHFNIPLARLNPETKVRITKQVA